jgi:hypothetical protein
MYGDREIKGKLKVVGNEKIGGSGMSSLILSFSISAPVKQNE